MVNVSERITASVRQVWIAKAGSTFRAWKPTPRKTPPRGESAARSLRAGMAEMFTLQRLKLPASLYKCLATTA